MNRKLNEKLINFINDIANNVFIIQFVVSSVGLFVTIPHLFILFNSSMRTSSTNSLMIGIAFCDLAVLSSNVYERVQSYWLMPADDPCVNYNSYWYQMSLLVSDILRETCERASFWIGIFLALTRLLIMKLPGNTPVLSKPILGHFLFLLLLSLSSTHTAYLYSGYRITPWGTLWEPEEICTGFPENYTEQIYIRDFIDNQNLFKVTTKYVFINGVSRILVSLLYPFLAIFLIFEIRQSAKFALAALSERAAEERHRTGRMILVMTVFYVIASLPGSASDFVTLFVEIQSYSILETLVGYGSIFISALFCFNATSHGFINFTMSSKYRKTVREEFYCRKGELRGSSVSITRSSSHI
ncbi:hypothetical protein GCK72_019934 [Caenorhabditis remanei]|uniref:G-protein coupled receptors family 1 profile domain-containing protein n=1 Tax=Caenorhabditis remanei TaxID=31234 RepID=A0A6A5GDQ5_CAERE|nr:hypothetical protein GCK72_019934 [Caenorhabditis remanei]KAF1753377.1 hypothetical protein GCK72_019934 [Caenorhabditis remanei]